MHDGQALVADFGIALAVRAAGGTRLTETGLSLGTPHYMSPEQAMGDREIDARSDVYSLGAMLYEMLAGDPPYTGSTAQAIVAKVITEKAVPVTKHRDTVPRHVAAAIHKALSKLAADRFPSAVSFAEALVRPALADTDDYAVIEEGAGAAERTGRMDGNRWGVVAGFVATMVAGIAIGWWLHPTPSGQRAVTKVAITLRSSAPHFGLRMAISPDGRYIAYVGGAEFSNLAVTGLASQRLFVRSLGDLSSTEILGSAGAYTPFFSPNGRWVGFITGDKLMKVPVAGGTPVLVAEITAANVTGASWGSNDVIVYSPPGISSLMRVSADGGVPQPVTSSEGEQATVRLRWPAMLPGGDAALVTLWSGTLHDAEIGVVSLESGVVKRLGPGVGPQYAAGHIVFAQADGSGSLLAAPFDLRALEITGPVVPVADRVRVYPGGASQYAISGVGTLIFQPIDPTNRSLILVDRDGEAELLSPEFRPFRQARISPDGIRVAMVITDGNDRDVWIYDLEQGTLSRLTSIGDAGLPSWTPDGAQVTFSSNRRGSVHLYWQPWDGSASAEPLVTDGDAIWAGSWSADGRSLFFRQTHLATGDDIMMLSLDGDGSPEPFLVAEHGEIEPAPSPDGRWVAYASDESGQWEIYVRPYPARGGRIPVSRSRGTGPVWAPSGRELFYSNGDSLMVARVETESGFRVLSRTLLFRRSFVANGFDVHPDGDKFLMLRDEEESRRELVIVFNWFEELRSRMAELGGGR